MLDGGVNIWQPDGRIWLPTDDLSCVAWYICPGALPGYGVVTPSDGSVENNVHLWGTKTNLTTSPNQTDPDGGTNATLLIESNDGVPTTHTAQENTVNAIASYADMLVWIQKPSGGRNWVLCRDGGGSGRYLNPTTGASIPYNPGCNAVDMGAEGGGRWFLLEWRGVSSKSNISLLPADDTPNFSYTGDGRDSMVVYMRSGAFTQPRASAWIDQTATGADLVQAAPAQQPGFGTPFDLVNGLPAIHAEAGRSINLDSANATLLSVFDGVNPIFAICGVGKGAATPPGSAQIVRVTSSVGYSHILEVSSTDVRLRVYDGVAGNTMTFVGAGTALASANTFALLGSPGRQWELFIGGISYGVRTAVAVDTTGQPSLTSVPWQGANTATSVLAEASIFSGAGAYTYSGLLRAIVRGMGQRWGGLAA